MIPSLAWADLISHEEESWTGGRDRAPASHTFTCKIPGCGRLLYLPSNRGGAGMCGKHARAFYRHGHPLGAAVKATRDLVEAALGIAEGRTEGAVSRLCDAAAAFGVVNYARQFWPRGAPDKLIACAETFCDAETDAEYARAWDGLKAAAVEWSRGVKGGNDDRMREV